MPGDACQFFYECEGRSKLCHGTLDVRREIRLSCSAAGLAMSGTVSRQKCLLASAPFAHAKNDEAREFYQHFDFHPSPIDPLHLFPLLKDIRALFR
jgi:hypothetical protein